MNTIRDVIYRLQQGESLSAIHRATAISRKTVRKYARFARLHQFLDPCRSVPELAELQAMFDPPASPPSTVSSVEPFRKAVSDFVDQEVGMKAIWQRLREEFSYTGGYSSVVRFVKRHFAARPVGKIRIETEPGEEAQVDFGFAGTLFPESGKPRKVWVFVMTLSWSRHQYIEFVLDQKIPTWISCHENAFRWFGGVPKRITFDNLKSAVLRHTFRDPVLGEPYRRLAQHYGLLLRANDPYHPEQKGKVESGVGYVKGNFLAGRRFADLQAMNDHGRRWVMETAGIRIHGTTGEPPLLRFREKEQGVLLALPSQPVELVRAAYATVQDDCHIHGIDGHYSVPASLIGKHVEVYVGRNLVEIFSAGNLITTHPKVGRGKWDTRMEHYPPEKQDFLIMTPDLCRKKSEAIGPSCHGLVQFLLSDRVQDRLPGVQSLLRLPRKYSAERVEAACQRACFFQDQSYRRVKAILLAGQEFEALPNDEPPKQQTMAYSFARPMTTFFKNQQEETEC